MANTTRRATLIIEARDNASRAIGQVSQSGHAASNRLAQLGSMAKVAAVGLGGMAAAGIAASIKLGMSMEQTRIAFKTLIGSEQEAQKHLEELRAFAAKTPFQFTDLIQASRRLQAFGFAAKDVIPMLRDIGDAVSAMGGSSEMIDRVTLALGQMMARGKVSGQEMLQLTEAGIPAWRFLAEAMGKSTAEIQKMSERGLIPADKAIQAILGGMRENFGGMMAEQAKTAGGQLSNLVDALEAVGTTISESALPGIKEFIRIMQEGADAFKLWVTWNQQLEAAWREHLGVMADKLKVGEVSLDQFRAEMERAAKAAGFATTVFDEQAGMWVTTYHPAIQDAIDQQIAFVQAAKDADQQALELSRNIQKVGDAAENSVDPLQGMRDALGQVDTRMGMLREMMGGAVGKELKDFREAQDENREKSAELRAELEKLEGEHGRAIKSQKDNTLSANELTLATLQLAKKQQELAEATDPMKQAQLAVQVEKLQEKLGGATDATTTFVDNSKRIGEIRGELSELDAAYAANVAAHRERTGVILFNIAAEQLAMDGLTKTEVAALRALGVQWGLFDEATGKAMQDTMGAVMQLAEDQSLQAFRKNMDEARDAALHYGEVVPEATRRTAMLGESITDKFVPGAEKGVEWAGKFKDKLAEIPPEIIVKVKIQTEGTIPDIATGKPGEPVPFAQHGMPLRAGQAAIVGDRGTEFFVPRVPGFVVNMQQAAQAAAMAATDGRRGGQGVVNNYNTVINDRLTGALWRTFIASRRSENSAGMM